jgi:hypothetical protein
MNDQFSQVKLAFDVVLGVMGLPNVYKYYHRFFTFSTCFSLEEVLSIECQIPSLKLVVELLPDTLPFEERLLYLEQINEKHHDAALANGDHKKQVKC